MIEKRIASCELRNSQLAILIVGLGNPLRGDDGIGPRVVAELRRRGLPEGVEAIDGGSGGLDLLRVIEGWGQVVVVDAADVGREPGQFVRFTPEEARLMEAPDRFSLHHASLAEALSLARALDHPLPPLVVFGVQPERIGWGEGLSPAVEEAISALVEAVLQEARGKQRATSNEQPATSNRQRATSK
ncbi:MAG TPA: hydrogenase maturation protease [Anaerolineales bacterium]|nr:hydrogenase maturation protease [Anaerolineales bacterium]